MKLFVFVMIFLLLVGLLSSCVPSVHPNRLTITENYGLVHKPSWTKTFTNSKEIEQLFQAIYRLPIARGKSSCPSSNGGKYILTFYKNKKTVLVATVNLSGCRGVSIKGGKGRNTSGKQGVKFWAIMEKFV